MAAGGEADLVLVDEEPAGGPRAGSARSSCPASMCDTIAELDTLAGRRAGRANRRLPPPPAVPPSFRTSSR